MMSAVSRRPPGSWIFCLGNVRLSLPGRPLVIADTATARQADALAALIEHQRVTRLVAVPSLLRELLGDRHLDSDLPRRPAVWTSSGELLPSELAAQFVAANPQRLLLNL